MLVGGLLKLRSLLVAAAATVARLLESQLGFPEGLK